jgi:hypothetical protein
MGIDSGSPFAFSNGMSEINNTSYQIIGYLSNIGEDFYYQEALVRDIVQTGLYSFISCASNKNLTFMILNSVRPLLLNCPNRKEMYDVYLPILLPQLLQFLTDKLDTEWKVMRENGEFRQLTFQDFISINQTSQRNTCQS